ncbi:MAG: ATP-binding protein [Actinomycetota bacterium]
MADTSRPGRRPTRSLRVRITAIAMVLAAALLAAGGLAMMAIQRNQLVAAIDDGLREDLRELQGDDRRGFGGFGDGTSIRRLLGPGGADIQIIRADGELVASASLRDLDALVDEQPDDLTFATVDRGARLRIAAVPIEPDATLIVADDLGDTDEALRRLGAALFVSIPALVIIMGAAIWVVTGRALRPVDELRREVDEITAADLHRRVAVPDSSDELEQLATTMNGMLGRLDESARRQRQFVGDASHELRSPLAGMRSELEVNLAHPEAASWSESGQRLLDETVRLQSLVEQLLLLARGDGDGGMRRTLVDLDDLVLTEVNGLRDRGEIAVDLSGVSAAQVSGDPIGLAQVVRNLLDNAGRHADGRVAVSVAEIADGVEVVVHDDGPGVRPEDAERIFERFARLDEARARDSGGAGLGLAISREIVERHGGTLRLDRAVRQGARFVVRLPSGA